MFGRSAAVAPLAQAKNKQQIGIYLATALVIGNMIGSGIYLLPSSLAFLGAISIYGWIISGAGAILIAILFGRLSKLVPKSGGPYQYPKEGFGEFIGFMSGWGYWVSVVLTNASIAMVFTGYLMIFFPAWQDSTENFSWERGIMFAPLERVHQANGWGDAFHLGIRRTGQDMSRVGQTIGWIAGGKASVADLGGPVMIIKVAKDEAAVDVTRLLLFLTMLSANLAIINFLPIPILDGGHFVFLTIELIRRKPVSERIQVSLSMIFLVALLGFMLFIVSNDVFRLWIQ